MSNVVRFSGVTPASDCWEMCYLDDFSVVLKLPKSRIKCTSDPEHVKECAWCSSRGPPQDTKILEAASRAYSAHDVTSNIDKRFHFKQEFEVLGTHRDGHRGTVGTHVDKRRQLFRLCASLLRQPRVTKEILESLVGNFVQPFMHNRCLMTVFQSLYVHMSAMGRGMGGRRWHPIVFDELFLA
jgi:hypothetical protein